MGNASNVPTATALSGDVTIDSSGVTAISSGVIVNADVNASAAIAGTKISPDFGSQNTTTTGTSTAASFIPTSSTAPSNGVYLPSANNVAISTNGSGRLFIDSTGNVGVGAAPSTYKLDVFGAARLNSSLDASLYLEEPGANIVRIKAGTSASFIGTTSNHPFYFVTNNTERLRITSTGAMNFVGAGTAGSTQAVSFNGSAPVNSLVIDSSGRVGLGTSSADNKLSVGIASADEGIELKATYNGARVARFAILNPGVDNTPYIGSVSGNDFGFITSGTRRMTLDAAGRLGIGTTAPATTLEVNGTSYVTDLLIRNNAGTPSLGTSPWLYSPASGALAIATNASERVRIDSSGRLLVGTSSQLGNGIIQAKANSDSSTGEGILLLAKGDGATAGQNLGQIKFTNSTGNQAAWITALADTGWGGSGSADYPGALTFATTADGASSPTEAMRITSNQNIYIGSGVDDSTDLTVATVRGKRIGGPADQTIIADRAVTPFAVNRSESDNVSRALIDFYRNGANPGSITATNTATAYNTSSDYRLKENVVPLTGAVDRLNDLQVHRFNFIADPDTTVDGFLAHEAQAVVPECATGNKDEVDDEGNPVYQGIDQSKLVPLLTAALQEALAEIESLKARLTAAGI
jgi:hypothetical protein